MKERLTLTINPQVLRQDKQWARRRNASLSSEVENLLRDAVSPPDPKVKARAPFSRRWMGKLKIARQDDPRYELLAQKYDLK